MDEKIIAIFNNENVTEDESKNFRKRLSVRALVFDPDSNIALLYSNKGEYHTLPGGGVGKEETFEQAVIRECKEEIGCDVEIKYYLGSIIQYWKEESLHVHSAGYVCKVIGDKGSPIFMGDESDEEKDSEILWIPVNKGILLLENDRKHRDLYMQYAHNTSLLYLQSLK